MIIAPVSKIVAAKSEQSKFNILVPMIKCEDDTNFTKASAQKLSCSPASFMHGEFPNYGLDNFLISVLYSSIFSLGILVDFPPRPFVIWLLSDRIEHHPPTAPVFLALDVVYFDVVFGVGI